ncbi:hypothetical protein IFR04_015879 [Cadophora malorum]|uniref:Uncharacterized protein n=1 Tax=Cadophora malorum TaxID=108018 RepID=A0A8H7W0V3_9HELO|nr:hypothetical protein IFR04_015879 [Cadophora malorum]
MMKGKNPHDWKGPIIIASQPGTSIDLMFYKDVTPTSLRVAADFFKCFGSGIDKSGPTMISGEAAMQRLFPEKPKDMVQGVQIASKGDVILHGKIKFTEVQAPLGHPIFNIKPTEISNYMGIPSLMKVGGFAKEDMEKADKMGFNALQNRTALFLNMEADTHDHRWGWAEFLDWHKMIGTVLVVRQDKKALTTPQVEALAKFYRFELCLAMGELSESFYSASGEKSGQKHIQKAKEEFVKTQMCKEAFEKYFFALKKQNVDLGVGTWEHALSPYAL